MLDHGYGFERVQGEIDAFEGLDPEEQSALWAWAWTANDMGGTDKVGTRGGPYGS